MKMTITLLTIAILGIFTISAQASHKSPDSNRYDRIDKRIANQHYRIRDGIGSGELTRREARHLRHQQRYIIRLKFHFMNDGYLDRYEFRELRGELDRASERIYRLKHNNRTRYAGRYYY